MDHLAFAIKHLSPQEKNALLKKIKTQKVKLQLFSLIEKDPKIENKQLTTHLAYGDNYSGLYTLKNRLFDDIISIKLDIQKNVFYTTKENVAHLRALVFSRDKHTLSRELSKSEKHAINMELYGELKEIYFCYFLSYKHNDKKREKYTKLIRKYEELDILSYQLEQIFYAELLDTQDLFYFYNKKIYNDCVKALKKAEQLHLTINNSSSLFLHLSTLLTLYLNSKEDLKKLDNPENLLNQLSNLYSTSFLSYKYPNCHIAIQCLYNKYYLVSDNEHKFIETLNYIKKRLLDVKGYQMFDDSIFYYLYVSIMYYADKKDTSEIISLIEDVVNEEDIEFKSEKIKSYYYYILALKNIYQSNYKKSSYYLMLARNYFNKIDTFSSWIIIENILLNIWIYLYNKDYDLVEFEIYLLKRKLKKLEYPESFIQHFKDFVKIIREAEKKDKPAKYISFYKTIKSELGIMKLVNISLLENHIHTEKA